MLLFISTAQVIKCLISLNMDYHTQSSSITKPLEKLAVPSFEGVKKNTFSEGEVLKHIIDCALAGMVSFFTIVATTGMNLNLSFKDIVIPLGSAILIGLIKFRDYWQTDVMHTIFF
jgi:hypothetical protein